MVRTTESIDCKEDFVFTARGTPMLRSLADLRGKVVGITHGYPYSREVMAATGFTLEVAASDELNLRKLAAGRIDVSGKHDPHRPARHMTRHIGARVWTMGQVRPGRGHGSRCGLVDLRCRRASAIRSPAGEVACDIAAERRAAGGGESQGKQRAHAHGGRAHWCALPFVPGLLAANRRKVAASRYPWSTAPSLARTITGVPPKPCRRA